MPAVRFMCRLLTWLALPVCGSASDARAAAPLVTAALVPAHGAVVPGQPLWLGVRLDIAPGWHLYWDNPGDSGLPTRARVQAPPGYQVGAARYPGPLRFTLPGGVRIYGYEHHVTLPIEVRPPTGLSPGGAAAFTARASWLACSETCVPGKADLSLTLPVRAAAPPDTAQHVQVAQEVAQLPRPLSALPGAQVSRADGDLRCRVPDASEVEFFPTAAAEQALASANVARDGAGFVVRLLPRPGQALDAAPGVLRVRRGEKTAYYQVEGAP